MQINAAAQALEASAKTLDTALKPIARAATKLRPDTWAAATKPSQQLLVLAEGQSHAVDGALQLVQKDPVGPARTAAEGVLAKLKAEAEDHVGGADNSASLIMVPQAAPDGDTPDLIVNDVIAALTKQADDFRGGAAALRAIPGAN